jgi:hypothetical protein
VGGRRVRRHALHHTVGVGFVGARLRFTGVLLNISTNGMLVRCAVEVEPGTMMRAGIEVGTETLRVEVVARRTIPGKGVGFEFTQMSHRDRQKLHLLLAQLAKSFSK